MSEPEPPFRPREKLIEKQRYYQSINKPVCLKGPYDKITSVAIPLSLAITTVFLTARGLYNMAHGIGKKEMRYSSVSTKCDSSVSTNI